MRVFETFYTKHGQQAALPHQYPGAALVKDALAQELPSNTVRQNWDEPLGKTPPPSTGLPPITCRVLHFLVHAVVLLSMGIQ